MLKVFLSEQLRQLIDLQRAQMLPVKVPLHKPQLSRLAAHVKRVTFIVITFLKRSTARHSHVSFQKLSADLFTEGLHVTVTSDFFTHRHECL